MTTAEKNPFELEGRLGGPSRNYPSRVYTPAEKEAKLAGYLEVDPDLWAFIGYSEHIRYILKTGEFRTGGFVLKNPFEVRQPGETTDSRCFKLRNGLYEVKGRDAPKTWTAAYASVEHVYVKLRIADMQLLRATNETVNQLNTNIGKVAAYAKKLEARLAALER